MPEDIRVTFKKNLNRLLSENNIQQRELAKIINVSPTAINNWVLGYNVPRMELIDKIASALNVNRSALLLDSPQASATNTELKYKIERLNRDGLATLNSYIDFLLTQDKYIN